MPATLIQLPTMVNLVLYEGDDFTFLVSVTDSAGQPADLTGVTARAQIRETIADDVILGELTATVEEVEGNIWLHLDDAVSAVLPPKSVWDVEMDRGGEIVTLAAGTITVTPDVTRDV
jgi:hypothetical protein